MAEMFPTVPGRIPAQAAEEIGRVPAFDSGTSRFLLVDGALVSRKRDFTGWTAELIQHMIDHCKGKLV